MTAAASSPDSSRYRLTMWLAHREPHALVALIVIDTASRIVNATGPSQTVMAALGRFGLNLASLVVLVATLAAMVCAHHHNHALCTRCAGKTPVDPAAEVARHDRALRWWHWVHDGSGARLVAPVAVLALAGFLLPPVWRIATSGLVWGLLAIEAGCGLRHRPLEPWCPYCRRRWGDGGDEEVAPTPPPVRENVVR